MPNAPLDSVLRHVRQLAVADPTAEMSDNTYSSALPNSAMRPRSPSW